MASALSATAGGEEALTDALESLGELARDDPELVRVTLGELRQRLQVLVRQKLGVRVALVDRVEDRLDGLGFSLRATYASGALMVLASLGLTGLSWGIGLAFYFTQ